MNMPWKFRVDIAIRSVSGRGGQEGGDLEDIEGSWPETWRTWLFLTSWMMFFYPNEHTQKFCVDISIRSPSGRGGQEGGYLEDVEGSWLDTWRTWLFLTLWMIFYPKEDTLKILCWYLNYKCFRNGGSRRGVLGGRLGFLTRDMNDRVLPCPVTCGAVWQGQRNWA